MPTVAARRWPCFFLASPSAVLIISPWNYYNLIRYYPSRAPGPLALYCKATAIIRRVCSLRRRVISRLIPNVSLFVVHTRT